jgi:hypothetical protein
MKWASLRFTLRESLLATLAIAALLGWWVNTPRWDRKNTQFYQAFDVMPELRAAGVKSPSSGFSRGGGIYEFHADIEAPDDPKVFVASLRQHVESALKSEANLRLLGWGKGSTGGFPNFDFRYRKNSVAGMIVCRTFPAPNGGWKLYILIHEVSMK